MAGMQKGGERKMLFTQRAFCQEMDDLFFLDKKVILLPIRVAFIFVIVGVR